MIMPHDAVIDNLAGEQNFADNVAHHTITTPSIDLAVQIVGDPQ